MKRIALLVLFTALLLPLIPGYTELASAQSGTLSPKISLEGEDTCGDSDGDGECDSSGGD